MPAKNDDRLIHEADQRITRVRQRDAVADARAVQLLALTERAQQRLPRLRQVRELGNLIDQLAEHGILIRALQVQIDGCRRKQFA